MVHRSLRTTRARIPARLGVALGIAIALILAGCAGGTRGAPRTITVTDYPTPSASTGGGITVVAPSDLGSGSSSGAPSTESLAGTTSPTSGGATAETSTGATSTTTSTTTLPPIPPSVAAVLESGCPTLLTTTDISAALGKSLPDKELRVVEVPNVAAGMTGRTKCYYGTDDLTVARPLAVALAAYATADAAKTQIEITANSEIGLGAQNASATVNGKPATVLLRDGGLLMMQVDTWTLSIAIANGVVSAGQLAAALQKLATAVLARVG